MANRDVRARKGRPMVAVDKERLTKLRSLKFTWDQIGSLMGTSAKTLQRRAKQWNLKTYSTVSDADLDSAVQDILSCFPTCGEVMMTGHLLSRKVCVYMHACTHKTSLIFVHLVYY